MDGSGKRLALVVEDEALVRAEIVELLADLGFAVAEADCVRSALVYLQQQGESVSLLLTDLHMPGTRNGATLANHVSFIWPHIKILVTSGAKCPITGELPFEAAFISKPLTAQALMSHMTSGPASE